MPDLAKRLGSSSPGLAGFDPTRTIPDQHFSAIPRPFGRCVHRQDAHGIPRSTETNSEHRMVEPTEVGAPASYGAPWDALATMSPSRS
jgi:hypothetical protein